VRKKYYLLAEKVRQATMTLVVRALNWAEALTCRDPIIKESHANAPGLQAQGAAALRPICLNLFGL